MKLKSMFTKKISIPVLGDFSFKDIARWGLMALLFGAALIGLISIPTVGGYVSAGYNKVRRFFPWN